MLVYCDVKLDLVKIISQIKFNTYIFVLFSALQPMHWNVDYFLKNESECVKLLENTNAVREIPSLNSVSLDNLKDGQLVRFQGMLQDMYNPEYFLKKYQVINKQTGESSIKNGMLIDGACQVHNMKAFFEGC